MDGQENVPLKRQLRLEGLAQQDRNPGTQEVPNHAPSWDLTHLEKHLDHELRSEKHLQAAALPAALLW